MPTRNCDVCGTQLFRVKEGEWFCPNHGVIVENQEWDKLKMKEGKNERKGEKIDN